MNNNENIIEPYAFSLQSLLSFMENSQNSWFIKDNQSRYIYVNEIGLNTLNTPKNFNIEGRSENEIPVKPCQELWSEFIEYDKKVMAENKAISSMTIHHYDKGHLDNPVPMVAEKKYRYTMIRKM